MIINPYNFPAPVTSYNFEIDVVDWTVHGVTDEASFASFLSGRTNFSNIVISDFVYSTTKILCNLSASMWSMLPFAFLNLDNLNITYVNGIGNLDPLVNLNLSSNNLALFNPNTLLSPAIQSIELQNNFMTTSGYTTSEAWANAQNFLMPCTVNLSANINLAGGTNLETILLSKGCTVTV
jgi:hypothetical protein